MKCNTRQKFGCNNNYEPCPLVSAYDIAEPRGIGCTLFPLMRGEINFILD